MKSKFKSEKSKKSKHCKACKIVVLKEITLKNKKKDIKVDMMSVA